MENATKYKDEIADYGFTVIDSVFSESETASILKAIQMADTSAETFRKTTDLFAIRKFLKEIPETVPLIFTVRLKEIINRLFGASYFVVKSIYFDKPPLSNWFVSYHQDLSISVDRKHNIEGYDHWTVKQNQYAVQPPVDVLQQNFTVRIHLDHTDKENGALRVIPGSHMRGIFRPENIDRSTEVEIACEVRRGGIMIMRPLLLHASDRTTDARRRRVIHIEFSNQALPEPLRWAEML